MLTYTYISKGKFGLVEKPKPTIDLTSVMIANDSVYYSTKNNPNDIYHANLDFTNSEIFQKNAFIQLYNNKYIILRERSGARISSNGN